MSNKPMIGQVDVGNGGDIMVNQVVCCWWYDAQAHVRRETTFYT